MSRVLELPQDEVMKHFNHLSIATFTIMTNTFDRFNMTVRLHEHLISGELVVPPSGYFSGACGNVQRAVDDVVVTGLLMSDDRLRYFKYSATTYLFRSACLFLADGSLGSVDALLVPFTLRAWLAISGVALAGAVLHKCFRHVEGDRISWSEGLLSSVGTFTGQGPGAPGRWFSCQGLLVVLDVLFMLLDGYYNSAIVKSLLRPPPPSVRNVHDLLDSNYPVALNDWWLTIRNFQVGLSWRPRVALPPSPPVAPVLRPPLRPQAPGRRPPFPVGSQQSDSEDRSRNLRPRRTLGSAQW
ncbi:Translation initiation factor IF-2 [Frankliniella fusca]|uniref:Translation initiation factor IF-2 n=1 Tax=Frankliniella fusca TaxID=407009 RepID=A0AAE1HF59_9NEOP|nr:Translation initiation factor IF-2 [Frankliniella fusca]